MLKYLLFSSINHMEVKKIIISEKGKYTIKLLLLMTKKKQHKSKIKMYFVKKIIAPFVKSQNELTNHK